MVLGDTRGARELFEKGFRDPALLDPQPTAVQTLALMAQARRLDGDPEGAAEMAIYASQLIERARAQGWDDVVLANYDPVMKEIIQLPAFHALPK